MPPIYVKVLVFGATGFVGFSVSQALARLETFEELTRNEIWQYHQDLKYNNLELCEHSQLGYLFLQQLPKNNYDHQSCKIST
ncbi:unnamed protein product [Rhizophagus irregularis]|nr:unnamed protein product [Rhizophagus irregularis]CAB5312343.1 unnamed protein product [Rhizophagus irregularis]